MLYPKKLKYTYKYIITFINMHMYFFITASVFQKRDLYKCIFPQEYMHAGSYI